MLNCCISFQMLLCAGLLALNLNPCLAFDTLAVKKQMLIGPPELILLPPVDSAVLRKLFVTEQLHNNLVEQAEFKSIQNINLLKTLMLKTEIAVKPDVAMISIAEELLIEYIKAKDLKNQALVYNTYGVYYATYSQPEKATYNFMEALKLKEILGDTEGSAQIAQNLTAIYKMNGQYDLAIKFAQYVASANIRLKKTTLVARAYMDIASMKSQQKKYEDCEYYILRKAFPIFMRTGNKYGRMNCFQDLANLYFKQQRYSEAKWFFIQSQIMANKLSDSQGLILSLTGLAKVKHALGEPADALKDYKKAEELALQNNYLKNLIEINAELGEVYNQLGDYQSASTALDHYSKFRESWLKTNKL